MVSGGGEDPCVPEHFLAAIREREERPRPRVDLEPDNLGEANAISLAISDHAGLTPLWFETLTEGMDPWERQAVLSRVVRTLLDGEVTAPVRRPPSVE